VGTEDNDRSEHVHDDPTAPMWGEERYPRTDETPSLSPVSEPPTAPSTSQGTQPDPVASSLRGRHIAWARLERAAAPVTQPPPANERAQPSTAAATWSSPPPPRVERPVFDPGMPSALGRLVALIVTCGIGWAVAVAVGIWLLVFFLTRAGG